MSWPSTPPEPSAKPSAPVSGPRKPSKAQVFEEKAERARTAAEEAVRPGTCPACGQPVMYSRALGLLTVVDALPVREEWRAVAEGRTTYMVVGVKLKRLSANVRRFYSKEGPISAHAEHTGCGRITPVPVKVPRPPRSSDGDVPPFEDGSQLKTWRCWNCDALIPPEKQGVVIQYSGPRLSYYYCHCDADCETKVREIVNLGERKPKYPKIDKFGHYAEPKKGEVLPDVDA